MKEDLRLEMILSTYRDKLEDLGEEEFINWVEKIQFPKEKKWKRLFIRVLKKMT